MRSDVFIRAWPIKVKEKAGKGYLSISVWSRRSSHLNGEIVSFPRDRFHRELSIPVTQIVISFSDFRISFDIRCAPKKLIYLTCKAGDIIKRKSSHIFALIPQSQVKISHAHHFPQKTGASLMNSWKGVKNFIIIIKYEAKIRTLNQPDCSKLVIVM